jgi:hypothetical protein
LNDVSCGSGAFLQNGPNILAGKSFEWRFFLKVMDLASNHGVVVFEMIFLRVWKIIFKCQACKLELFKKNI